jgi:hypothetical protein
MGIRTIIAIGLGFIAVSAQAAPTTNSWDSASSHFWDQNDWSLGQPPSITDGYDFITNAASKTVTIDENDTSGDPGELTISNLTVVGFGSSTNTLNLTNMNEGAEIPLTILNGLTIGNDGVLEIDNSMLQMENGTFTSGSILVLALGTNSSPVVVSSNLTLAGTLNVANGGGLTNTTYTLFTYGGTLSYSGLAIGSTPSNTICAVSTNTAGQVNLGVTVVSPLPLRITSIALITNTDVELIWTEAGTGTNAVQAENGGATGYTGNTNNFHDISGLIVLNGNTTTNYIDRGGVTNSPSRFYRVRVVQ